MRDWLFAGVLGLTCMVADRQVVASDQMGPQLGGRLARMRDEQNRTVSPYEVAFRRAQFQAQQRVARLEAYYNAGLSPNRPSIPMSVYSTNVNPGLYKPWVLYYMDR